MTQRGVGRVRVYWVNWVVDSARSMRIASSSFADETQLRGPWDMSCSTKSFLEGNHVETRITHWHTLSAILTLCGMYVSKQTFKCQALASPISVPAILLPAMKQPASGNQIFILLKILFTDPKNLFVLFLEPKSALIILKTYDSLISHVSASFESWTLATPAYCANVKMDSKEEDIETFQAITGVDHETAEHVLEAHAWNLNRGINFYIESSAAGSNTATHSPSYIRPNEGWTLVSTLAQDPLCSRA